MVAERCILEQNNPLIPFLPSAGAANAGITVSTVNFGLEVERRSTPRKYTVNVTPPIETQISFRYPVDNHVARAD